MRKFNVSNFLGENGYFIYRTLMGSGAPELGAPNSLRDNNAEDITRTISKRLHTRCNASILK